MARAVEAEVAARVARKVQHFDGNLPAVNGGTLAIGDANRCWHTRVIGAKHGNRIATAQALDAPDMIRMVMGQQQGQRSQAFGAGALYRLGVARIDHQAAPVGGGQDPDVIVFEGGQGDERKHGRAGESEGGQVWQKPVGLA